jgi:D-alanyl-D-alanine carboxypeptidase (penicillin-binding protein 5/6)
VGAAAAAFHRPVVGKPAAAVIALPQSGESAISISGGDDYLGSTADGIFASSGGAGALPMASISKLITAMVVLSARPLGTSGTGPTITWDKADAALYDKYYVLNATIAAMKNGSSMSEHDALETMLVVSACNYAEAMADWAFGSEAGFVSAAKKWLKAHGLTGTTMVEPTGLDNRNKSTPSDLIALGKLAMADPAVAAMVGKTSLDVPALAGLPSTNDLLGTDGVNGIKTGTLDSDGSDLLFSAVVPVRAETTLTITGVVLGGSTRAAVDDDVKQTIESIQNGFHDVQLGSQGQVVGSYSTPWGAKASMVLAKDADAFTWSNTPITSTMKTTTLKKGATGETVGSVTWVAGKTTVTVPVVLKGSIRGPSTWWRLTHPSELLGK